MHVLICHNVEKLGFLSGIFHGAAMTLTLEKVKKWYEQSDSAHDFEHARRVYLMAEKMAEAEGADLEIVRAAALLHDVRGGEPGGEGRDKHHLLSASFAGEALAAEGWPAERIAEVQHCIRSHRFRSSESPSTIEAKVIFDADKIDVIGATGAARTIAFSVHAGEPIFAEPSQQFLQRGEKEPGEPHSAYHEFVFKLRRIKDRLLTKSGRALAAERHKRLVEFFEQLAAEMRGDA